MKRFIFFLILFFLPVSSDASDRCCDYIPDVRASHALYFGPAFPYHYGIGQIKQESSCRDRVTAFDQGMGPCQFMPSTSKWIQSLMGQKLDPYNRSDACRMQAFYMYRIHKKENWTKFLWIDYQIYNGGRGTLYNEYKRAGKVDWKSMKASCNRKTIILKSGKKLDFCEVNYDYSQKVFKYGKSYQIMPDSIPFWGGQNDIN